tara:strand:+ start:355 stop:705 length:351 start_codon:yes stop_codon:yes gene_type:complete
VTFEEQQAVDRLIAPLKRAIEILGDRAEQHGDHVRLHRRIAQLWSAYLRIHVAPYQVAALMALLKIARSEFNAANADNYVDLAGYAAIYAELLKIDRPGASLRGDEHHPDTEVPES